MNAERDRFIAALIDFIERTLIADHAARLEPDTYLFDEGLIDSLKILQLIAFVEQATGRLIPDHEIVMKNFRSARTIAHHFWTPTDRDTHVASHR